MAKGFDISKFASTLELSAPAERDIETITAEIIQLKRDTAQSILDIGHRLNEAKEMLPHGEWLPWLTERVEFTERTAQKYMRLAREWPNTKALSDLGLTKAFSLLSLPSEERDQFMAEQPVIDMTSRELERAIRERDEARQAAEAARAEAQTAEESRARMALDMAALEAIRRAAQESSAQAREALEQARAELQALREKPVEVAVETVVDQEAVEEARADAYAKAEKKFKQACAEAQHRVCEANAAAAAVKTELQQKQREIKDLQFELKRAKESSTSPISTSTDLATFKLLFDQTKEAVNKLQDVLLKVRGQGDADMAEKLKAAMLALSDEVRRCAE